MKAALILLSLFFLMVTFRARALEITDPSTPEKEELMLIKKEVDTLIEAKDHFVAQIKTRELPIREYLSYGIYRESCHKLSSFFTEFKENYRSLDNSNQLSRHLKSCRQGVDGLAFLYSQQNRR